MAQRLNVKDSISEWITKINAVLDLQNVDGAFVNNDTSWSGTTFTLSGGKVRSGTNILDVPGASLTLPVASVSVVGVNVSSGLLESYLDGNVPASDFIPMFVVTTNNERIISAEDVRTWAYEDSGAATAAVENHEGKADPHSQYSTDKDLRQDLDGAVAQGKGALQVRGSVIYVDTIADLQALDAGALVVGQHANVRGTIVKWDGTNFTPVQYVNVKSFGAVGDGLADDTAAFSDAVAFANGLPIVLTQGTYIVSNLTLSTPVVFQGEGVIRKKAGTIGHLIRSTSNLAIDGDITLDQNATNCPNPNAGVISDCAISHDGDYLFLRNIKSLDALTINIQSYTKKHARLENCSVTGGTVCVDINANDLPDAKVEIIDGVYTGGRADDNIKILRCSNFTVRGVESSYSRMSGIVAAWSSNGIIEHCYCHNNKPGKETGQGGWGIVLSILCHDITVSNNNLINNRQGGITVDLVDEFSQGSDPANIIVTNNNITGDALDLPPNGMVAQYGTHISITGNLIKNATYPVRLYAVEDCRFSENIVANAGSYFLQVISNETVNSINVTIDANSFTVNNGDNVMEVGRVDNLKISNNTISAITGSSTAIKFLYPTSNFQATNNKILKKTAGSGYVFESTGDLTNGIVENNYIESNGVAAFQYYWVSRTTVVITNVTTKRNCINVPSMAYLLYAEAMVADGDTINGSRDVYSSEPNKFKVNTGHIAIIAGVAKYWDGSVWVAI